MRWHPLFLPAAAVLAGTLALSPGSREPLLAGQDTVGRRFEVARLRAHFDSVDAELHAAQPRLRSEQRAARVTLIGWLREYRNAGEFPRNDRYLHATPFFGGVAGSAGGIAGIANLDGNNWTQTVAATNVVIGGGALAAGLSRLIDHRPVRRESAVAVPTADGARLGFAVHATF